MFEASVRLRKKLAARPDSEHIQAYLRIFIGFVHAICVFSFDRYASPAGACSLSTLLLISAGIVFGGLASLLHISFFPATNHVRRWVGVIQDMTWTGLTIFALGDSGAPMFGMYIWVVIGNGFRYGTYYLYGSAALALVSFYTVAYVSPYYSSDYGLLGLGTFLLAVVLPFYLGNLLRELQRNLEAAREADRLKTRFLSNVSHDLRTPLNVVMANCDLLAQQLGTHKEHLPKVQDMQKAATTLNGLLEDLLDVAKIEAGRIRIMSSPFNVLELLGRVARFNEITARKHETRVHLTIEPNLPVSVYGDTLRLEQVLNNIVSNAVKYTDNGDVHIYARADINEQTGHFNGIICSVSDTGIGMEPEEIGRVFSRFEQADVSYARRYSGAGLGLSIANELVNLMGGWINVESAKGAGSRFTICVPLEADSSFDSAAFLELHDPSVLVICADAMLKQYWRHRFNGRELPNAEVLTLQEIESGVSIQSTDRSDTSLVMVDADGLDSHVNDVTTIFDDYHADSAITWILANIRPKQYHDAQDWTLYKEYRCILESANTIDIRKALAIAYWTKYSDDPGIEDGKEIDSLVSSLKGLTVLIADDSELNRRVMVSMLAYLDARVLEAEDGAEALRTLFDERVDIALLDIQMPEMTGIEVMRVFTQRKSLEQVPFLALTADTTDECRSRCLDAGATSVLYKPVVMKSLFRELRKVLLGGRSQPAATLETHTALSCKREPLDYTLLHELTLSSQRPDYIATLVACFRREGSQLLQDLCDAFGANNIAESRALLHRLKGMSGSIGAQTMAALCHDTLALSDAKLATSARTLADRLSSLHHEVADELDKYMSETSLAGSTS